MNDLEVTRKLLSAQLTEAIATDPLDALPTIVALKRDTEGHLREAVKRASLSSSWSEIADRLGVSKQAAHQRFKAYAEVVAGELKTEHRAMKRARRAGDTDEAAKAQARRDGLVTDLRSAAQALRDR